MNETIVLAAARAVSDRYATGCGVNPHTHWILNCAEHIADVRTVLDALGSANAQAAAEPIAYAIPSEVEAKNSTRVVSADFLKAHPEHRDTYSVPLVPVTHLSDFEASERIGALLADLNALRSAAAIDSSSRAMFVARLEAMQRDKNEWLTTVSVLALLNDCDRLAQPAALTVAEPLTCRECGGEDLAYVAQYANGREYKCRGCGREQMT